MAEDTAVIRYAIFLECANKSLLLLYGTQGYISPDLHDRAVPGHDSYFYRHACECSVRAVLSVTPSQTHKNEKNTNLLLLCVHAHREAHSIGLLSAWSTRSCSHCTGRKKYGLLRIISSPNVYR